MAKRAYLVRCDLGSTGTVFDALVRLGYTPRRPSQTVGLIRVTTSPENADIMRGWNHVRAVEVADDAE